MAEDRTAEGGYVPGGPALYSARTAHALGARVTLVTALRRGYDTSVLEGIDLRSCPTANAPRYANTYDAAGSRSQLLLDEGPALDVTAVGPLAPAAAVIIAPAYHEFSAIPALAAPIVAVSLQGILRAADEQGRVHAAPDALARTAPFAMPGAYLFLSEEDTPLATPLARHFAARGTTVFVTRGYRGAVCFQGAIETHFAAVPARATDPTGAGDCFLAAFVVRLCETADLAEATRFALAAGALATEAPGAAAVPTRAQVEARLAMAAA